MPSVMILAAGFGTRLRPLTDKCPKPLVPIGDRPAIFHVLDRVESLGPIVVNAHHFADELAAALSNRVDVNISREPDLLGTAGGVAHAEALLGAGDVLVWNSDVLAELDAAALVRAHRDADATLAVRPRPCGEGNVGIARHGRIVRLRRESFAEGEERGGDFLGIHVLGANLRARLPAKGCLVGDVYLPQGNAGATIRAFETDVSFVDVGTLDAYLEANFTWLRNLGERSMVRAQVPENVSIGDDVVIPSGAIVEGTGNLTSVVAWPGARVVAPLERAIVTPHATVRVAPPGRAPM